MWPAAFAWGRVTVMSAESIVGLVISVGLLAYLVYAMLRPEKF